MSEVPEPGTLLMLISGLAALAATGWRKATSHAASPIPEPSTLAVFGVGIVGLMFIGAAPRPRRNRVPA